MASFEGRLPIRNGRSTATLAGRTYGFDLSRQLNARTSRPVNRDASARNSVQRSFVESEVTTVAPAAMASAARRAKPKASFSV